LGFPTAATVVIPGSAFHGRINQEVSFSSQHPIWASNTWGHNGSGLTVQDDGNTVIYDAGGHPLWATNTWLPMGPTPTGSHMRPGETLAPGQQITSASGRWVLMAAE